ncbi:MAG: hypothetical protein J6A82_01265 [Coprococcus sp.]|nr:hypothetical protein [Coprococcus sp.]
MKFIRLLARDIKLGICRRWYFAVFTFVFGIIQGYMSHTSIKCLVEQGIMYTKGTLLDYIMLSMQGMPVYVFDPKDFFEIPIYWFVFQMGMAYFVAYYAIDDFEGYGKEIIVASKTRGSWWMSKCAWCSLIVAIYHVIVYMGIAVAAWMNGANMTFNITQEVALSKYDPAIISLTFEKVCLIVFVLPVAITIAVSLLQMFLSFIVTPAISFAAVCGMYVLSAYYTTCVLPGSFTMWIRSTYMDPLGVVPFDGVFISICIAIFAFVMGLLYMHRKDIM